MNPELVKANAAVRRARKRLSAAFQQEEAAVVAAVGCWFCGAPKGQPCRKNANPEAYPYTFTKQRIAELTPGWEARGVDVGRFRNRPQPKTRPHANRRKDAEKC